MPWVDVHLDTAALGWAADGLGGDSRSVAVLHRLGFELVRTREDFGAEQGWFRRELTGRPVDG